MMLSTRMASEEIPHSTSPRHPLDKETMERRIQQIRMESLGDGQDEYSYQGGDYQDYAYQPGAHSYHTEPSSSRQDSYHQQYAQDMYQGDAQANFSQVTYHQERVVHSATSGHDNYEDMYTQSSITGPGSHQPGGLPRDYMYQPDSPQQPSPGAYQPRGHVPDHPPDYYQAYQQGGQPDASAQQGYAAGYVENDSRQESFQAGYGGQYADNYATQDGNYADNYAPQGQPQFPTSYHRSDSAYPYDPNERQDSSILQALHQQQFTESQARQDSFQQPPSSPGYPQGRQDSFQQNQGHGYSQESIQRTSSTTYVVHQQQGSVQGLSSSLQRLSVNGHGRGSYQEPQDGPGSYQGPPDGPGGYQDMPDGARGYPGGPTGRYPDEQDPAGGYPDQSQAPGGYPDSPGGYGDPQQGLDDLYSQRYAPQYAPQDDRQPSFQQSVQGSERQGSFRPPYSQQGPLDPSSDPLDSHGYPGGYPNDRAMQPSPMGSQQGSLIRRGLPDGNEPQFITQQHLQGPGPGPDIGESRWRDPDLPEVIDYLSHPNDTIKANSAAYLQHLCYRKDDIKTKTRELGGIPALVELLRSDNPDVHKSAAGALRNLSFGQKNDENKRAIRNCGGIPELRRLLERSSDRSVHELVTGILWNLSSVPELKKPVIEHTLTALVDQVLFPLAGTSDAPSYPWTLLVFRNASGVLRNVSSEGEYARRQLRECPRLVDIVLDILRSAITMNDMDNKAVENCVCLLRNLSFACQEVRDPEYLARRDAARKPTTASDGDVGCFGKKGKKAEAERAKHNQPLPAYPVNRAPGDPVQGMELLWQPEVLEVYLPLLKESTNPETLEAAAGAVQNLAACDWQPAVVIRAEVRDNRQLPIFVELLNLEADRVVCASATALRNLAIDTKNKDLIGKYAIRQLAEKIPSPNPSRTEFPLMDETVAQIEATIHEVVKDRPNFAKTFMDFGGCEKLIHICRSADRETSKTPIVRYAAKILHTMWSFKELHDDYKKKGWRESDFIPKAKKKQGNVSGIGSRSNTLERQRMGQSGPAVTGYNDRTVKAVQRTRPNLPADFMQATPQMSRAQHTQPQAENIPLQTYAIQNNLQSAYGGSMQGMGPQYGGSTQGLAQGTYGESTQGMVQPPYGGSSQMLASQGYPSEPNPYAETSQGGGMYGDQSQQPYPNLNQSYQEDLYARQQPGGYPDELNTSHQGPYAMPDMGDSNPQGYYEDGQPYVGKAYPGDQYPGDVVMYNGSLPYGDAGQGYDGSGSQVGGYNPQATFSGSQVGGYDPNPAQPVDPRANEPLYATVNKDNKRRHDAAATAASPADDSWV